MISKCTEFLPDYLWWILLSGFGTLCLHYHISTGITRHLLDFHFFSYLSQGRYTYGQQPKVCRWNCYKLYEMLNPLLDYDEEEIEKILVNRYDKVFESTYMGK